MREFPELKKRILEILSGKKRILIVGIGENRLGDDGFGPYLTYQLINRFKTEHADNYSNNTNEYVNPNGKLIKFMNAGIVFESRVLEVVEFKPDILLLLDAIEIENMPDGIFIGSESEFIPSLPITSHSLPVQLVFQLIRQQYDLPLVYLLGIHPESFEMTDRYIQFKPDVLSMEDFDENADLPFFEFNLSDRVEKVSADLLELLYSIIISL